MGKPKFNPINDFLSGAIMAATSVPQLVSYAELVGYASYRGLQTAGPPLFAYGLTTGSPFMSAGVTSITALMCKSDLDGEAYVAQHGEEAYVTLVAQYSLCVGLASVFLALVGFGKLAKGVPKPVRTGFKWGCAVGVFLSAMPNGIFAQGSGQLKTLAKSSSIARQVAEFKSLAPGAVSVTNLLYAMTIPFEWGLASTILFVFGTAFVVQSKNFMPKFLPPGTEVILVTGIATVYSIHFNYDGSVVGEIPQVDPDAGFSFLDGRIRVPVEFLDLKQLVMDIPETLVERFGGYLMLATSATLFAAVNFLSIMGIASGFEAENGIPWSAEREMVAQGVACGVAAAVGSAPVSGSMSRSLVSRMTGTTSQLSALITALAWIYLLPYMSIMSPCPKAALSSIIISAVLKSVVIPSGLLQLKGIDSFVGWGTGVATLLTSPTTGFGAGLVLAAVAAVLSPAPKAKQQ
ncbi:sulfate transporter [Seminavis robusta]|uniref:Sulfate transporter n=1 Tax=Seminavis robusta TaxID=568900 RepID=A0A9N8HTZ5_9STRA|nr:sulfate transporter [Seminavis robusta]|eukprot:Sro1330_g263440.1 sulfate transporter (462) ;mRNA; r:22394-23984